MFSISNKTSYHTLCLNFASIIVAEWAILVLAKYLYMMILVIILLFESTRYYLETLRYVKLNEDKLLSAYNIIQVSDRTMNRFLRETTQYSIVYSLIILSFSAWFTINCFKILPLLLIFITASVLVLGLRITLLLLRDTAYARIESGDIVRRKRRQHFTVNRHSKGYYYRLKWLAQQELPICCGGHFSVDQNAFINYFCTLNECVTNVVLLVLP